MKISKNQAELLQIALEAFDESGELEKFLSRDKDQADFADLRSQFDEALKLSKFEIEVTEAMTDKKPHRSTSNVR